MKKNNQRTLTCFFSNFGGISLYDIYFGKTYLIEDEDINLVNGYGYAIIGNSDSPDGTSTDHEYFFIHNDLFDKIIETDQNEDIALKMIHKEVL